MTVLHEILEKYWGYQNFRNRQEAIIRAVVSGRDVFAMLPTGAGKSLCYQVPALALDGLTIVISPLIALMRDQVMQLRQRHIPAAAIYTGMDKRLVNDIVADALDSRIKLLYVSPERLQSAGFREVLQDLPLSLIAVDEAHCISQWGHEFRPAYRQVHLLRELHTKVPVIALTASATLPVQSDIVRQLELRVPELFVGSTQRRNIAYRVIYSERKPGAIPEYFAGHPGSGILYTRSRRSAVETAAAMQQEGFPVLYYHAGMYKAEREQAQQRWMSSHQTIISATTAFGMGIDKPDVRNVVHYDAPFTLEEYYQEAGRAGRDGHPANAVLFYNNGDMERLSASTAQNYPPAGYLKQVYNAVADYLQVAVGSGAETIYNFDIVDFGKKFNLNVLTAISAVRLLEREGFWKWDDDNYTQTQIVFSARTQHLEYLEKNYPALSEVCVVLLRLYGSIFRYPTAVDEYEIAKQLRIDKSVLEHRLRHLAAMGLLQYRPALKGSTLYWQQDRMPSQYWRIDTERIAALRAAHQQRVAQMTLYLENETVCRSVIIARYFGEEHPEDCGICDVCLAAPKSRPGNSERAAILSLIRKEKQIDMQTLLAAFADLDATYVVNLVRELNDEGLCRIYPTGIIFAV